MSYYLWDDQAGMFFDYDIVAKQRSTYESATAFWPMWAGLSTNLQASHLVRYGLPRLEIMGGLAAGSEQSRGDIGADRPEKQWDFPYGWAPHQMLAWEGLLQYGYPAEAQRLVYNWLHMIVRTFKDFGGAVVEKYNVTDPSHPHKVSAEYGNQGLNFQGRPLEGYVFPITISYEADLRCKDSGGSMPVSWSGWTCSRSVCIRLLECVFHTMSSSPH